MTTLLGSRRRLAQALLMNNLEYATRKLNITSERGYTSHRKQGNGTSKTTNQNNETGKTETAAAPIPGGEGGPMPMMQMPAARRSKPMPEHGANAATVKAVQCQ